MSDDLSVFDFGGPASEVVGDAASYATNLPGGEIVSPAGTSFWSRLGDVAGKVGGAASDVLSGVGSLAKGVAPFAGMGAGILGLIAQRDAANRIAQQRPVIDRAQSVQTQNAEQARPYAEQAAALSPQVASVAPKLDAVATKVAAQTGQPVVDYATQLLQKTQAGEIPDAYKAKVENWRQAAKAKVLDYLARSGQADSSARVQLEAWVDQQADAMFADVLGQEEGRALDAFKQGQGAYGLEADILGREAAAYGGAATPLGTAGSILTGSSNAAAQVSSNARAEEQTLEQLIAEANRNLTRVAAGAA